MLGCLSTLLTPNFSLKLFECRKLYFTPIIKYIIGDDVGNGVGDDIGELGELISNILETHQKAQNQLENHWKANRRAESVRIATALVYSHRSTLHYN